MQKSGCEDERKRPANSIRPFAVTKCSGWLLSKEPPPLHHVPETPAYLYLILLQYCIPSSCRRHLTVQHTKTQKSYKNPLFSNINPLKPRFLYVPPGLTLKNSTWCSLCVGCFIRISKQTATFALYIINLLAPKFYI
jgi:hypothetical protein